MWIDSHCHLDAPDFDADRDEVVAQASAAGVAAIVNLPGHVDHFAKASKTRERYGCITGFGIHPMWVAGPSAHSAREHVAVLREWVERENPSSSARSVWISLSLTSIRRSRSGSLPSN